MGIKVDKGGLSKKERKTKLKKSSTPTSTATATARSDNAKPTDPDKIGDWVDEGDCLYFVKIEGVKNAAVVSANSKAEAREKFIELFGILSSERAIVAKEVDEDHGYTVNAHGVVDPKEL